MGLLGWGIYRGYVFFVVVVVVVVVDVVVFVVVDVVVVVLVIVLDVAVLTIFFQISGGISTACGTAKKKVTGRMRPLISI